MEAFTRQIKTRNFCNLVASQHRQNLIALRGARKTDFRVVLDTWLDRLTMKLQCEALLKLKIADLFASSLGLHAQPCRCLSLWVAHNKLSVFQQTD